MSERNPPEEGEDAARRRAAIGLVKIPALVLIAGLVAGVGFVALGTTLEVTSQPDFCGSCHVMRPYYESWKTSSHSNIACVDCHIPPGAGATIRKKYEALSMVTSYFTGTYGTNPWAEVDDASCLRCHERRLLAGRELYGNVLFDHTAHLSGMRRGKDLRCTSCHSQIVQGSHIAVTESTCILCHFKGQTAGEGTARCTLCHAVPDTIVASGTHAFDHASVGRLGMNCTWCHARPAGSDGAVPRERCMTCHNDPPRLAQYDDTEHIHRTHVSEHKVDCLNCHLEIDHVGPARMIETGCETCHSQGHSPQSNLYAGIGGRGVDPMPDPMFSAGVRCEGCHIDIPGHGGTTRRASEVSCMSCHGPAYLRIYQSWQTVGQRAHALGDQIVRTAAALGGTTPPAFADARYNQDLVARGHAVHNVTYSAALLQKSHDDMNAARALRGLAPLPRPWKAAPYASACLSCHIGIETQTVPFGEIKFPHERHAIDAGIDCLACHQEGQGAVGSTAEGHGRLRFGQEGCASCHHTETAGVDCATCHASILKRKVDSPLGEFDHAFHIEAGAECATCHQAAPGGAFTLIEDACSTCH